MTNERIEAELQQINDETNGLIEHAKDWIADGWELPDRNPSPEQIAAALLMEANTQDICVKEGESVPEYPILLRQTAVRILNLVHPNLL